MVRLLALVTALFMVSILAAGCGGGKKSLLSQIKKKGVMTFATDGAYPPMEMQDPKNPGQYIGFDVDLGKAIAKKIGVKYEIKIVDWDGIIPGLAAYKYDVIMSSMNITDERSKSVDFVHYFDMGQLIVVKKGNPLKIGKLDDLKGKTIAVQISTTNEDVARKIQGAKVKTFQSFPDAMLEVANGRADATILDEPVARYYAKIDADKFEITGQAFEQAPVGVAVPKNEKELYDAVKKALDDLHADGTYDKIFGDWFGGK
ncbi:MAG: basic amino acid ABC transporter substrate-binding protein [Bacillota bacterium]